jgi:hypothetical protein
MSTFFGFNTQNIDQVRTNLNRGVDGGSNLVKNYPVTTSGKKFRLSDTDLVIRDFINALNIPQGQKPGKPEYGTTLWSFVFEPNVPDVRGQLEREIQRVASLDPRIELNTVTAYPQDEGILIELDMAVTPFNDPMTLSIMFDQKTSSAFGIQ